MHSHKLSSFSSVGLLSGCQIIPLIYFRVSTLHISFQLTTFNPICDWLTHSQLKCCFFHSVFRDQLGCNSSLLQLKLLGSRSCLCFWLWFPSSAPDSPGSTGHPFHVVLFHLDIQVLKDGSLNSSICVWRKVSMAILCLCMSFQWIYCLPLF